MSACIDAICAKYGGSRIACRSSSDQLDIALVPNMIGLFNKTPAVLDELVEKYPIRGAKDEIIPETVQWVGGDNAALKYRGHTLKREKIWLQNGSVRNGYAYYYYTGVQWAVVPAQTDWAQCPEFMPVVNGYNAFCEAVGAQKANQAIITRYRDGDHFIGAHFDKPKSIAPSAPDAASLITVIKIGPTGRRFNLYDLNGSVIWSQIIEPGDALIMTLEANLQTKHEVPTCADGETVGDSGSIVFRSISSVVPYNVVKKKIAMSESSRARARARKMNSNNLKNSKRKKAESSESDESDDSDD